MLCSVISGEKGDSGAVQFNKSNTNCHLNQVFILVYQLI